MRVEYSSECICLFTSIKIRKLTKEICAISNDKGIENVSYRDR